MIQDLFKLDGKVALVTGGSRGLGKEMARALAEAGADVIVTSRSEDKLKDSIKYAIEGTGRDGHLIVADVADREQVKKMAEDAIAWKGHVDILINNAGTNRPQDIAEVTDKDWDEVLEINLSSIMALTRAVVPQMRERKWGRIIHISSIMGIASKEKRHGYSATKAALITMAKSMALDLGHDGITVNCIAPGPFLTELPASLLSDAEKKIFSDRTAMGRWGDPKELTGPMLFLASDASSYVTGETLVVDGGYLAR